MNWFLYVTPVCKWMALNCMFYLQAYFVDLDVKPLDKMPHYFKLDQKIVNFYTKNGDAGRVPCDSSKGGSTTQRFG
jgi:inositol-pentakisphosphate 2-kinase